MLKSKRYFLSIILILVIFTSIAYLGQVNQSILSHKFVYRASDVIINEKIDQPIVIETKCNDTKIETFDYNFVSTYPWLRDCNLNTDKIKSYETNTEQKFDYSQPAPSEAYDVRVLRGILVYFPIDQTQSFMYEFRWLYRSWTEMMKNEPSKWRTDLIVFIENDKNYFNDSSLFLNQLNCSFLHRRTSPLDEPMCTLLSYEAIKDRDLPPITRNFQTNKELYDFLLRNISIYNDSDPSLNIFYNMLKIRLTRYGYVDSILMAFDGYSYFKSAGYNFLIRSDMDVFLTPLFAKWLPKNCNDFYVGRGGYSSEFNTNRLGRIASNLGFEYAWSTNLGSTWYSTPDQFRLVSYLTLFGMSYISNEEFSQTEREGKLGVLLWPDWHYGVLLLYGQNLVMNHLIKTKQLNIVKLFEYLDYPSHYKSDINKVIHVHVFHSGELFSKFEFKAGKYDNMTSDVEKPNMVNFYSLKMALEGKRLSCIDLSKLLLVESEKKN